MVLSPIKLESVTYFLGAACLDLTGFEAFGYFVYFDFGSFTALG